MGPEGRRQGECIGHDFAVDAEPLVVGAQVDAASSQRIGEHRGRSRMLFPRLRAVPEEKEHGCEIVGDLRRCGHCAGKEELAG